MAESEGIFGITRSTLWKAWRSVRSQVRHSSVRDVVDYLEYDIDPDNWIRHLLREIAEGTYQPATPRRFTLAKSKGFSRRMALPAILDLVVYRTIVDYLYTRMKRQEHEHVYFERAKLAKVSEDAAAEAREAVRTAPTYGTTRTKRYLAWLNYEQYRRHLLFEDTYPYIVTTDITNFFDTILHSRVTEALRGVSTPSRMVGLLFFLLERLSVRHAYMESPGVGLPVDEFDCSRKLAHIFLYAHDERIVRMVGEKAYVRWMDDQLIGVASKADGLNILSRLADSLSRLHLTPNASKSRVLSLSEARRHYHLDINSWLDHASKSPYRTVKDRRILGSKVRRILSRAKKHEGGGEWNKILGRLYRLAGLARTRVFRRRALDDLLRYPDLARRIADYMRVTGTAGEYIAFTKRVWGHEEQVYGDVNLIFVESLLRLEAKGADGLSLRSLASALLTGRIKMRGHDLCAAVAPLLILRFGDRRSLPTLLACLKKKSDRLQSDTVRSAAIVYASHGVPEFNKVRRSAAKLLTNPLARVIRMIEGVQSYVAVPDRWKLRFRPYSDSVAGRQYLDMRGILAVRLLNLNSRHTVKTWIKDQKNELLRSKISQYDKDLLNRLL